MKRRKQQNFLHFLAIAKRGLHIFYGLTKICFTFFLYFLPHLALQFLQLFTVFFTNKQRLRPKLALHLPWKK